METFADYILSETDWIKKMEIMYYLKKKTAIFFDKSVVLKTYLAKLFLDNTKLGLDSNTVLTACLLCNCKKSNNPQDLTKIKSYAKDGADYLGELGFSDRFCKICEEVNRYSGSSPREKESDVLELIDQFGGMILSRPERIAFKPDEALVLLEYRNLKGVNNIYLDQFKDFINEMQEINMGKPLIRHISETMDGVSNDYDAITTVASMNPKVVEAIKNHKEEKDKIPNNGGQNQIVTGDDIREEMMRPMMEETREEIENTDSTEHTR